MNNDEGRCKLYEIEQFICALEGAGNRQVRCYPLPRIFRICPDRPAVEITALVKINAETGELVVPERLSEMVLQGKTWRNYRPLRKFLDPFQ